MRTTHLIEPMERRALLSVGLVLVDAGTGKDIMPLVDGSVVDVRQHTQVTIAARTDAKAGSVLFDVNGDEVRLENSAPFVIGGDKSNNKPRAWKPPLGEQTIRATTHKKDNGRGGLIETAVWRVKFVDGAVNPGPDPDPDPEPQPPASGGPAAPVMSADAIHLPGGADLSGLKAGHYVLDGDEYRGGFTIPAGVTLFGGDAVIDGEGLERVITIAGGTLVGGIVRGGGVESQDNHRAAVLVTGDHSRVFDTVVEKTRGVGLAFNKTQDVWFVRVLAQDNGVAGIAGSNGEDIWFSHCISRRNNSKGDSNGGGGKITRVDRMVVDNHQSYQNKGVGLWFDYSNINVAVRHSEVWGNVNHYRADGALRAGAAGIFFEISGVREKDGAKGTLIAEFNYVHDNECEGIQAWGSQNVTIRDNRVENNLRGQVVLRNHRNNPFEATNIVVERNILKGPTPFIGSEGGVSFIERDNTILS